MVMVIVIVMVMEMDNAYLRFTLRLELLDSGTNTGHFILPQFRRLNRLVRV